MRRERWRNFDFWLFGVVIVLCFFGIVMIQSALAGNLEVSINSQILYVSIGLVFILACAFFDYHYKNEFSFKDSVDGMIVSGKVKLLKPDRAIYEALMNKYGLKPEECVFFDDRLENVEGARKCGINAIVFKDYESATRELERLL